MAEFDAYVMVDWSANARPKSGKDSVWWCIGTRRGKRLHVDAPVNSRTREDAAAAITAELRAYVADGFSVLIGFDFPYGYPHGFAASLGLAGPPWRATWDSISDLIRDSQVTFFNNRFDVVTQLNRAIGAARPGPFWGCPNSAQNDFLLMTKPVFPFGALSEFRVTERRIVGPKSTWQIHYNGSVGSQALLGIPYLARMREDPQLKEVSQVWPFETGLTLPPRSMGRGRVVHAEIYPSFIAARPKWDEVKDSAQVRALVEDFADRDRHGQLQALFEAPARLTAGEQAHVLGEEGWILGLR